MSKASEPKIKDYSGQDYTRITFYPDLVTLWFLSVKLNSPVAEKNCIVK
jgi:hypothetical protein